MNQELKHRLVARSLLQYGEKSVPALATISINHALKEFPIAGEYNYNKLSIQLSRFLKIYRNLLKSKTRKELEVVCKLHSHEMRYKITHYNKKLTKKEMIEYLVSSAGPQTRHYLHTKWRKI